MVVFLTPIYGGLSPRVTLGFGGKGWVQIPKAPIQTKYGFNKGYKKANKACVWPNLDDEHRVNHGGYIDPPWF